MNSIKVRKLTIGEGRPKICIPIVGRTEQEILGQAEKIQEFPADIVEWRADWFEAVENIECVKRVLCNLREILGEIPLLFTFRTQNEGGEKEIAEEDYFALNLEVIRSKYVDLIDVEIFRKKVYVQEMIQEAHAFGVSVIASNHDFEKTPGKGEIIRRLCEMQKMHADILKIAVMPQSKKDVLMLLEATEEMKREFAEKPIVTMAMGGYGVISRISGEIFGSAITFGAAEKVSAPGQIGAVELKNILDMIHEAV